MLLAGFYQEINPIGGGGISGNATGSISLENKSHGCMWIF